jgi:hypothetical protein
MFHLFKIHFWKLSAIIYFLYFCAFIGIVFINLNYIHLLSIIVQLSIAIFIILKFSPLFRKKQITISNDESNIILSSGILLLITLLSSEFVKFYSIIRTKLNLNFLPQQLPII